MDIQQSLEEMTRQRDEKLNQELAAALVRAENAKQIEKLASFLEDPNPHLQRAALKTMYEIGYVQPEWIAPYVHVFLRLLRSRQNNLVWGAMIALSTIAHLKAADIMKQAELVKRTIVNGSVISKDKGVRTLALVAADQMEYNRELFPFLLEHLNTCRPKDVPQHAEHIFLAVNDENRAPYVQTLRRRLSILTQPQARRVRNLLRQCEED